MTRIKERGQSLAELSVGMAAVIPILLLIPVVGGYLNLEFQANQASRHAAWQTTVYPDLPEPTSDDGSLNGTARQLQIQLETMEAFFRHPLNGLGINKNTSQNALLVDAKSTPSSLGNYGERSRILANSNGSEVATQTVLDMTAKSDADLINVNNTAMFKYLVDVPQNAQDSSDRSIKSKNLYNISLKVPLNVNSPSMQKGEALYGNLQMMNGKLYKESKSAIIANSWIPINDQYFNKIVCRAAIGSGSWKTCGSINGTSTITSNTPLETWELRIPRLITQNPVWLAVFPEASAAIQGNYNLVPAQQSLITP